MVGENGTDTAAVRHAIINFAEVENRNEKQAKEIKKLKKEADCLRQLGYALKNALEVFSEVVVKSPEYLKWIKVFFKNRETGGTEFNRGKN